MDNPRSKNAKESIDAFYDSMIDRALACEIEGSEIIIDPKGERYPIKLDSCDTHEKLVGWIVHLSRKRWITVLLIEMFILTAYDHHDLEAHPKLHPPGT
ncbi:MAG: hypothetical protein H7A51_12470 [Akkermansiaceae bacterium]|nr:hypothetical protein [Akkermansiaceae bacterium]